MLFRFLFALLLILNIKNVQADQISSEEIDKEIDFIYRSQFPESEMLITQIRLRTWPILSDALTVYKSNQDLFLPIAEFSKALDFPIYISDKEKVASGWFINENQKFYLNLVTGVVEVNGKKYLIGSVSTPTDYDISQDNIKIIDGDIYANSKLLEKWFDLKIVFDPLDQLVQIDSAQPLPIEERVDRDRKWDEFNKNEEINNQSAEDENLETIRTPFKLISTPLTDVRLKQDISKTANGNNAINQVDLLVSGDALHLNHKLFASVTNGSLSSARLTSGQRDPDGKLLGPLKATEFSFGDVFTPETPLVARTVSGKGAVVTNYPQEYVSDFNTVPIIGNIQPGWDVELYRNDSLIGFKRAGKEGFYEFLNVPLMTGMNIVKLVFYGPFGQRREEFRRFLIREDILKKGQVYYRFATNKDGENLINVNQNDEISTTKSRQGTDRFSGELAYGVAKNTSVVANFSRIPVNSLGIIHDYSSTSLRSSYKGVYGRFDYIKDLTSKLSATQTSLQTSINNFDLLGQYDHYDKNFISESHQTSFDPLINKTYLRFSGPLDISKINLHSRFFLSNIKEDFLSRKSRRETEAELSFIFAKKFNFTQNVRFITDDRITNDLKKK